MRTIAVPAGGATLSFQVTRDTEPDWDFLFVEAHTAGRRRLDDAARRQRPHEHRRRRARARSGWTRLHPFLAHYQTDNGDGTCSPTGTTGAWRAATGPSDGRRDWTVDLSRLRRQAGRGLDHLRERRHRPDPRRLRRRHRRLDGPGHDLVRGRRRHARRLDGPGRAGRQPAATRTTGRRHRRRRARELRRRRPARRSPASRRSSTSSRATSARTRSATPAASSTDPGRRLRAREPDPPDLRAGVLLRPGRQPTAWSSTSSPTSGTATASPCTAGRTSGSTRASRPTPSGCGASSEGLGTRAGDFDGTSRTSRPDDPFWQLVIGDPGPDAAVRLRRSTSAAR